MSIARKAYEKTPVGTTGSMQAGSTSLADLEAFQEVVRQFEDIEAEGLIEITTKHPETQSGKRLIDLVMFKRLA